MVLACTRREPGHGARRNDSIHSSGGYRSHSRSDHPMAHGCLHHLLPERSERGDMGCAGAGDQGDARGRQYSDRLHAAGRRSGIDHRPVPGIRRSRPVRCSPKHARRHPHLLGRCRARRNRCGRREFIHSRDRGSRVVRTGQRLRRRHDERRGSFRCSTPSSASAPSPARASVPSRSR